MTSIQESFEREHDVFQNEGTVFEGKRLINEINVPEEVPRRAGLIHIRDDKVVMQRNAKELHEDEETPLDEHNKEHYLVTIIGDCMVRLLDEAEYITECKRSINDIEEALGQNLIPSWMDHCEEISVNLVDFFSCRLILIHLFEDEIAMNEVEETNATKTKVVQKEHQQTVSENNVKLMTLPMRYWNVKNPIIQKIQSLIYGRYIRRFFPKHDTFKMNIVLILITNQQFNPMTAENIAIANEIGISMPREITIQGLKLFLDTKNTPIRTAFVIYGDKSNECISEIEPRLNTGTTVVVVNYGHRVQNGQNKGGSDNKNELTTLHNLYLPKGDDKLMWNQILRSIKTAVTGTTDQSV